MKYSLTCPNCKNKVTFLRVFLALTPFFVSCSNCNKFFKIRGVFLMVTLNTILSGSIFMGYIFYRLTTEEILNLKDIFVILCIVLIISLINSIIICNKGKIIKK